jgi:hypothetical protein
MNVMKKVVLAVALIMLPLTANAGGHGQKKDIVDTAIANGSFKDLLPYSPQRMLRLLNFLKVLLQIC